MTKSATLHQLDGTRAHRPDTMGTLDGSQGSLPPPPDGLTELETEVWLECMDCWNGILGKPDTMLFGIVVRNGARMKALYRAERRDCLDDDEQAELLALEQRQVSYIKALGVTAPQRARYNTDDAYDPTDPFYGNYYTDRNGVRQRVL